MKQIRARHPSQSQAQQENTRAIGHIKWMIAVLFVLSVLTFLFGGNVADAIASIDLCLFFVLCALWRVATVQNRNSERVISLLEEQNRLLRSRNAQPQDAAQPKQQPAQPPAQQVGGRYDNRTDDGRFVI